jgi:hypothetical protein
MKRWSTGTWPPSPTLVVRLNGPWLGVGDETGDGEVSVVAVEVAAGV